MTNVLLFLERPIELNKLSGEQWLEYSPSTNVSRFDSLTWRHKVAEFVGSLLCPERFFLRVSGFPLSSKTNIWFDLVWFTVSSISKALVFA